MTGKITSPKPESFGINSNNAWLMLLTKINFDKTLPAFDVDGSAVAQLPFETIQPIHFQNIKGETEFFMPSDWAWLAPKYIKAGPDSLAGSMPHVITRRLIREKDGNYLLSGVPYPWIASPRKAGWS